jgi:hypothetical protein
MGDAVVPERGAHLAPPQAEQEPALVGRGTGGGGGDDGGGDGETAGA